MVSHDRRVTLKLNIKGLPVTTIVTKYPYKRQHIGEPTHFIENSENEYKVDLTNKRMTM